MGHKSPAIHRGGAYMTTCGCKVSKYAGFSDAMRHARVCKELPNVLYCGAYANPRKVWNPLGGWCDGQP